MDTHVNVMLAITWTNPANHYSGGPSGAEPDKAQWIDPTTGYDCLLVRNHVGALCGYVGVPPEHPWHGINYMDCAVPECTDEDEWHWDCSPDGRVDVHGGLTLSGSCREDAPIEGAICHVPINGRPSNVWWFGFDCAHSGDLVPSTPRFDGIYRDRRYVQDQCTHLAAQLKAIAERG